MERIVELDKKPDHTMLKIGIDLGGTKTEAVILDDKGAILERKRVATEQEQGYDHVVQLIMPQ